MNAAVARIMAEVNGFPAEGHECDLDPEYAVFGSSDVVLARGIADEYAAEGAAKSWREDFYRPDAFAGQLCSDYRDHPREACAEHHGR